MPKVIGFSRTPVSVTCALVRKASSVSPARRARVALIDTFRSGAVLAAARLAGVDEVVAVRGEVR